MPGGRPKKYDPKYARMAQEMIRLSGFSIPKLAKIFNVGRSTIYDWMDEFPEFSDGVRQGRKVFDGIKIERSLVRRATGYRITETQTELDGKGKVKAVKKIKKTIPPDVAAIKHWQINMDQANWRDKVEHGFTDQEGNDLKWVTETINAKNDDA